jgi:hypothetical protein
MTYLFEYPRDYDSQFNAPEPCTMFGVSDSALIEHTYSAPPAPTEANLAWRKSLAETEAK